MYPYLTIYNKESHSINYLELLSNIGYKISLQLPDERLPTDTTTLTLKW